MHDLAPITALGGTAPRTDTIAGVTLRENPNLALASVAARLGAQDACRAHLADLLEGAAPGPGKCRLHDPETAFWMGPDHWMLTAPFDTHEDLAAQLKAQLGNTASVTEQTDAWTCFELSGDRIEAVMELTCNLNTRAMQTGDAHRTSIHHLGCYILRNNTPQQLQILTPRASAKSINHTIINAMKAAL